MFTGRSSHQQCWEGMGSRIQTEKPALERREVSSEGRVEGRESLCFPGERLWVLHLQKKWGWTGDLEEVRGALSSSPGEEMGHGLVI